MRPDEPFASLLQDAWLDNLSTLRDLQHRARLTDQQAATICAVTVHTWRRWLKQDAPNLAALRLMAILAGHIPWPGWDGWEMHNGHLFPPGYSHHGLSSGHLMSIHYERQLLALFKEELRQLRAEKQESVSGASARQSPILCLVK